MSTLILASQSKYRAQLLTNAGLEFEMVAAAIDERAIEEPLLNAGMDGEAIAQVLAISKASNVGERTLDSLVIGCDQTLSFEGELLHKVGDMEAAYEQLMRLSGKTHHLNSAIALYANGDTIWRHVEVSKITMRALSRIQIETYLEEAGDDVLSSVGLYQIEGLGVRLFDNVEGDFFSIIGLPLMPLLKELRKLGYCA